MRDINDWTKKIIDEKNKTITYDETYEFSKFVVYPVYSENSNITTILQDCVDKHTDKVEFTEVVGFYYGKPDISLIDEYDGKLQAIFN